VRQNVSPELWADWPVVRVRRWLGASEGDGAIFSLRSLVGIPDATAPDVTRGSFATRKLAQWKHEWQAFRRLPAGDRFRIRYQEAQRTDPAKPAWQRWLRMALIPLCTAIGVVLMLTPGPAVLFFALAAALLASQSLRIARTLDRAELTLRATWNKLFHRRHADKRSTASHR
jgi:hypothetical protein